MMCLGLINDSTPSCPPTPLSPLGLPCASSSLHSEAFAFHLFSFIALPNGLGQRSDKDIAAREGRGEQLLLFCVITHLRSCTYHLSLSLSLLQAAIAIIMRVIVASIWKSFAYRRASLAAFAQIADTRPRDVTVISARRDSIRTPPNR